jgi:stearoyl-CoA desaturase (delta-9 desaturase)
MMSNETINDTISATAVETPTSPRAAAGGPAPSAPPSAPPTVPPGVARASARSRRLERRIALVTVVTPFIGTLAAIALLWGWMIGPVELGILVVMYSLAAVGIGIGYHRLVSHQSFQTYAPIRAVFTILGCISAQGPPLFWAAIHRRHHQYSDRPGDPHSPNMHGEGVAAMLRGLWHAHTGWLFVHETTDWGRWVPDLLRDRALFRINQLYFVWIFLGLALPALAGGLIAGTWQGAALGFLWGGLVRMFLVHHTTWSINSVTHVIGTRPFKSRDYSRNNFLVALLTFGEGWHNNHHAFPTSAVHGLAWWQLDINKYVIRTLEFFGLAWDVNAPTEKAMRDARRESSREPLPPAAEGDRD